MNFFSSKGYDCRPVIPGDRAPDEDELPSESAIPEQVGEWGNHAVTAAGNLRPWCPPRRVGDAAGLLKTLRSANSLSAWPAVAGPALSLLCIRHIKPARTAHMTHELR